MCQKLVALPLVSLDSHGFVWYNYNYNDLSNAIASTLFPDLFIYSWTSFSEIWTWIGLKTFEQKGVQRIAIVHVMFSETTCYQKKLFCFILNNFTQQVQTHRIYQRHPVSATFIQSHNLCNKFPINKAFFGQSLSSSSFPCLHLEYSSQILCLLPLSTATHKWKPIINLPSFSTFLMPLWVCLSCIFLLTPISVQLQGGNRLA